MGHYINYNIDTRLREANLRNLENNRNESEETTMTNIGLLILRKNHKQLTN